MQKIYNFCSKISSINIIKKAIIVSVLQIIFLIIELATKTFNLNYVIGIAIFFIAININTIYRYNKERNIEKSPQILFWGLIMIIAIFQLIIYLIFF
ncbi:hypothetical protein [Apilactobacillus micheneri]|uniref:Uncharacterized protein n=1 Tax=Apilactobacillus micheneri TaxID=1899430 RepID=A0A2S2JJ20_9LACO|nr:hypothetical protein [Apilactobacillus micheneri]TPR40076.1 hypothetical protein DY121_04355 [Apilactobacillus micheneri]TPR41887.1 hypothetical protein DY123_04975 [Apilactobacillus micheneri]TPR44278.1 hypothetical protein DY130_04350 [Apilactobacillus micheneri]TPR45902.1 hypothetical protein DY128_04350 [Apilactobacillus micheneri]TPR51663.1 hypothetical protein DY126_04410 [Apilactobacillus micheneri]